jgi:hypothetical protein
MKALVLSSLLLLSSCGVLRDAPADGGLRQQLIEFVTVAGDAAMRLEGTRLLNEHAPQLVPMLDKDRDGSVSLAEAVEFIQSADAAQIVMLGAIYFR